MALVGLDGRWLKVNAALCELSGYDEEQILALKFQAMTHPDDLDAELVQVRRLLAGEIDRHTSEQRFLDSEGRLIWVNRSGSLIRDADGEPLHFVVHIQDISERKRLADALQRLADSDPLTNLWNRRRFEEELQRQISRRRRYGDESALLMIDLNRFKPVTDTYGHAAGDELLKAVATALTDRLRTTDSIARLGGDEFVVMLTNVSRAEAVLLSDELQAAIAGVRVTVGGDEINVTASIGMTILDGDSADARPASAGGRRHARARCGHPGGRGRTGGARRRRPPRLRLPARSARRDAAARGAHARGAARVRGQPGRDGGRRGLHDRRLRRGRRAGRAGSLRPRDDRRGLTDRRARDRRLRRHRPTRDRARVL
jgi:diguanylate cyclase (GGDEF)-like protein/PAS domain S-box-containing protein